MQEGRADVATHVPPGGFGPLWEAEGWMQAQTYLAGQGACKALIVSGVLPGRGVEDSGRR